MKEFSGLCNADEKEKVNLRPIPFSFLYLQAMKNLKALCAPGTHFDCVQRVFGKARISKFVVRLWLKKGTMKQNLNSI